MLDTSLKVKKRSNFKLKTKKVNLKNEREKEEIYRGERKSLVKKAAGCPVGVCEEKYTFILSIFWNLRKKTLIFTSLHDSP